MDWPRRSAPVLPIAFLAAAAFVACDSVEQIDTEELEAQLRDDPTRGGRVGQLVGLAVSQRAHRHARAIADQPEPACQGLAEPGERWVAELTLERRRGDSVAASWTETRTLDRSEGAVAMRYAARYHTRIDTGGSRGAEWRVTPSGTYVATQVDGGDRWFRRETEEDEAGRIIAYADGVLQSLLDAAGGWQRTDDGWTLGDAPLRCGRPEPRAAFTPRVTAGATATSGSLRIDGRTRTLRATWQMSDGSKVVANYTDRVVPLPEPVTAPPDELMIPITRDRSMYSAQRLLSKLAEDGLATVASPQPVPASDDDEPAKTKPK